MAIKKIMPLLLAAVLLFGLFSGPVAFAEDTTYRPNEDVNLSHKSDKDSSGKSGGKSSNSNNGGGGANESAEPEEEDWIYRGESGREAETTTYTDRKTLYYRWYVASGPGSMTVVSSGAQAASDGYHAGKSISARFSTVCSYLVYSEQWVQDTEVTKKAVYFMV
ncbi:hypothetical protein [Mahella australiensis]|uniref:Uncharacterized protein n=1 Tax=Mahella australiensis (strain DSM 15567 / CIP 107919 / 50-1 BON) TaxID=697281 RepID=F4A320_MAHA5|nr:hypothetical protein [Mahella australiensis]AEE95235.1 hypothetical protein Mahau_0011 [Mahella australiensis 50-1 BON]